MENAMNTKDGSIVLLGRFYFLILLFVMIPGFGLAQNSADLDQGPLYEEMPPILIQGNMIIRDNPAVANDRPYPQVRDFNPQTPKSSEFKDGPGPKNLRSYANSANRLVDMELAACVMKAGNDNKHLGYREPGSGPSPGCASRARNGTGTNFRIPCPRPRI